MSNLEIISTKDLFNLLEDPMVQIIDVRSVEAYNGWKEQNEKRGGHIKNARSLPLKWTNYIDWFEIVQAKNITPNHKLIIYGYSKFESEKVVNMFSRVGFSSIRIYDGFIDEWSNNESLPLDYLPRYRNLVSAEWLKKLIENDHAPEYDNNRYVICHAHYRNQEDYEIGHIPSAISLDTLSLESPETWNRRTPGELKSTLENMGISHDTTVILYGRFSYPNNDDPFPGSSAGQIGAIRCALIMMYAGVEDIRILNGGLQSWLDAGYELTAKPTLPMPIENFGVEIPAKPEYFIDIAQAKIILNSKNANLVSVRSWAEYIGEVSGYNYIEKKGRIKGSIYCNLEISDAYHMESFRNLDHTMREYQEVEEKFREVGITADKLNAFYCGTGWRAACAWMAVNLMGWSKISVFDGGWFEWSNDDSNPIETGDPTKKNGS